MANERRLRFNFDTRWLNNSHNSLKDVVTVLDPNGFELIVRKRMQNAGNNPESCFCTFILPLHQAFNLLSSLATD